MTPNPEPRVETLTVPPNGWVPNHPDLPAVIFRRALDAPSGDGVTALYRKNDWGGTWVWGVYDFHHYHSTAHEVLTVLSGSATLLLGGPEGASVEVNAGDALALPAGFGHRLLAERDGFRVAGAYPAAQAPDLLRPEEGHYDEARRRIAELPLPSSDPLYGQDGPLTRTWGP